MAEFPVEPMLSKAIIASEQERCTDQVLTIISMLQDTDSLFHRPSDEKLHADQARLAFVWPGGDHVTLLNIWEQWKRTNFSRQFCYERFLQFKSMCRARDVREQLVNICQRAGVPMSSNANSTDLTPVQKTLTAGFFYNTAELRRSDDSYIALKTKQVAHVHPSSSLFGQLPPAKAVLYYEVVMTSKAYMRQVMEIKPSWLRTTSNSPTLSNW
ncbi:DUF1605-domain-containing protein [Punctularia strigosozonata HHB-11173 SS5]|uniref:DUF1605-domain-containing protein n=1 Tax=Punctularia strigosozonata (strain HHB-11173) TaxID=741275 RepID=R7S294_PUNST|nr:DUF1605-domain-containing protein [Punctularia strigosozonata HHB-11173 SS5]EIN03902.1 DUF1605-domain-containing protein [Punctularia strigosozonata HHB-11173 SS5]